MPRARRAKKPVPLSSIPTRKNAAKPKRPSRRRNASGALAALGGSASAVLSSVPMAGDLLPGLGGYAATRMVGRLVRNVLGGRWPRFFRHYGPLGNLIALLAIWAVMEKWSKARKYKDPAVLGAGIAFVQTLLQTYLPGLSWLFDAQPALPGPVATSGVAAFRNRGTRYVSPGELDMDGVEGPNLNFDPRSVYDTHSSEADVDITEDMDIPPPMRGTDDVDAAVSGMGEVMEEDLAEFQGGVLQN